MLIVMETDPTDVRKTSGRLQTAAPLAKTGTTATMMSPMHPVSSATVEAAITPRAARAGTETVQEVALTAARQTSITPQTIAETAQSLA